MGIWFGSGARLCVASCATACLLGIGGACVAVSQTPRQSVADKIAESQDLLDINTATALQLSALPGMGAAYAVRIIAGRPYTAKNQLTMRGILPVAAYVRIKPLIIAHRVKR